MPCLYEGFNLFSKNTIREFVKNNIPTMCLKLATTCVKFKTLSITHKFVPLHSSIGTVHIVAVDFNPRFITMPFFKSSVGTAHVK